jgi:hypothetical protein
MLPNSILCAVALCPNSAKCVKQLILFYCSLLSVPHCQGIEKKKKKSHPIAGLLYAFRLIVHGYQHFGGTLCPQFMGHETVCPTTPKNSLPRLINQTMQNTAVQKRLDV